MLLLIYFITYYFDIMKRSFSYDDNLNSTKNIEPSNKFIKNDDNNLQNKRLFSDSDCSKNLINEDNQPNSRPKLNNTNCLSIIFDTVEKIVGNATIQKASEQFVPSTKIMYGTNNNFSDSHDTIINILNNISKVDYEFLGIDRAKSYNPFDLNHNYYNVPLRPSQKGEFNNWTE